MLDIIRKVFRNLYTDTKYLNEFHKTNIKQIKLSYEVDKTNKYIIIDNTQIPIPNLPVTKNKLKFKGKIVT